MGGNQSWLECQGPYQPQAGPHTSARVESGDPRIAGALFAGTVCTLFLLTLILHCGLIARRRKSRAPPSADAPNGIGTLPNPAAVADASGSALSAVRVQIFSPDQDIFKQSGEANEDDDYDEEEDSLTDSSDTSIDSVTARAAAAVASRRRSRLNGLFFDMQRTPSANSRSDLLQAAAASAAGSGVEPPTDGYDNPAFT